MTVSHLSSGSNHQNAGAFTSNAFAFSSIVARTLLFETISPNWITKAGTKTAKKLGFDTSGFDTKQPNGFDTCGFDTQTTRKTAPVMGLVQPSNEKNRGSLLISPIPKDQTDGKKPKRKQNRKKKHSGTHFRFSGVDYEINTRGQSGKVYSVYAEIMTKAIEQIIAAYTKHKRVFIQHMVLSISGFTHDNRDMTAIRKSIIQKLKRQYDVKDVGFIWVREMESAKQQHYHFALFLDGRKVWHHKGLADSIRHIVKNSKAFTKAQFTGFHQVTDETTLRDAIFHTSYFAKTRGKGYRDEQAKDYATSRLKIQNELLECEL